MTNESFFVGVIVLGQHHPSTVLITRVISRNYEGGFGHCLRTQRTGIIVNKHNPKVFVAPDRYEEAGT